MPDDGIGALNLPIESLESVAVLAVGLLVAAVVAALAGEPIRWLPVLIASWLMAIAVMGSWWSEVLIEGTGLKDVVIGTTYAVTLFVLGTKLIVDAVDDRLWP